MWGSRRGGMRGRRELAHTAPAARFATHAYTLTCLHVILLAIGSVIFAAEFNDKIGYAVNP